MNNEPKQLVRYIRDANRNPIAVVVAIGPNMVGHAVCSKKDSFSKKRGKYIASQRAIVGTQAVLDDPHYRRTYLRYDPTTEEVVKCDLKEELEKLISNVRHKSFTFKFEN